MAISESADALQALQALHTRLQAYEDRYEMTSSEFYTLYQQGLLDDGGLEQTTEYVRWASAYAMQKEREATGS